MQTLEEVEAKARYQYVNHAVNACGGNKELAAKEIGVSLATIYRVMAESRHRTSVEDHVPLVVLPPTPTFEVVPPPPPKPTVFPIRREDISEGDTYYHKDALTYAHVVEVNFAREAVKIATSKGQRIENIRNFIAEYGRKTMLP